jgi:hypothetical protein
MTSNSEAKEQELIQQVNDLQVALSEKQSEHSQTNSVTIQNVTGLDEERHSEDDDYMKNFLDEALTWSSLAEYSAARENIENKYNPDETFMNMFFPDIPVNYDSAGNNYNRIDTLGYTLEFDSMNSYVTDISSSYEYSYFSIVTCISSILENGEAKEASITFLVTYTVDADGNVSNIKGIL